MTTNPFDGMSHDEVRTFLAALAAYTGKAIAEVSWADLENYLARTRAALDQETAALAHLTGLAP